MSLKPESLEPIPEETARIAHAAFPKGTLCLRLRDTLGTIYTDQLFADLFPTRGQPAEAPWRLAVVTVLQFVEGLSDRQAAEAVRARLDWKYLLGLELSDPGFDSSVLTEFRARLLAGQAEQRLLDVLLEHCRTQGWLKARGRQRTDSTHVLSAVRALNRLELVGETLRHALNVLAQVAPEWLRGQITPEWVERYRHRVEDYHLPKSKEAREQFGQQIGADGYHLLVALEADPALSEVCMLPAITLLRQVWDQQYTQEDGQVGWRKGQDKGPAPERIESPYDPEAHFGAKASWTWSGYKVHFTETCDQDTPHLITHVATTPATRSDHLMTRPIQQALADKHLLPSEHLVDSGYLDIELLVASCAEYGIKLVGPLKGNHSWQEQAAQGYATKDFQIDWANQTVTCPQGKRSSRWAWLQDWRHAPTIRISFARTDCRVCPARTLCTHSPTDPRYLFLRPQAQHEALLQARAQHETAEGQRRYQQRAGVEGTLSQGIRVSGLRKSRYLGEAKTRFQHVATAVALNLIRLDAWIQEKPRAKTRRSHFLTLAAAS